MKLRSLIFLAMFLIACCVESIPGTWLAHVNTGVLIVLWIGLCMYIAVKFGNCGKSISQNSNTGAGQRAWSLQMPDSASPDVHLEGK